MPSKDTLAFQLQNCMYMIKNLIKDPINILSELNFFLMHEIGLYTQ